MLQSLRKVTWQGGTIVVDQCILKQGTPIFWQQSEQYPHNALLVIVDGMCSRRRDGIYIGNKRHFPGLELRIRPYSFFYFQKLFYIYLLVLSINFVLSFELTQNKKVNTKIRKT